MERENQRFINVEQENNVGNVGQQGNAPARKKIIILVGVKGHGKSSFIKMMVSDELKGFVKCSFQSQSCTKECRLYKMSIESKLKLGYQANQNIHLMDTPGIDSQNSNYLVMDCIRQMIIRQYCDILAVIYIKSCTNFRQSSSNQLKSNQINNNSSYMAFYKMFMIQRKVKDQISIFVFTNYDKCIDSSNNRNMILLNQKELQSDFKKEKIQFVSKRVNWINDQSCIEQAQILMKKNKPESDDIEDNFFNNQKDLSKQAAEIKEKLCSRYKEQVQWKKLKQNLHFLNQPCRYQQFVQMSNKFMEIFSQKIKHSMKMGTIKSYSLDQIKLRIKLPQKLQQDEQSKKVTRYVGSVTSVVGGGSFAIRLGVAGVSAYRAGAAFAAIASAGITVSSVCLSGGIILIPTISCIIIKKVYDHYKNKTQILKNLKESILNNQAVQSQNQLKMREEFQKKTVQKFNSLCQGFLYQSINPQERNIVFDFPIWLEEISFTEILENGQRKQSTTKVYKKNSEKTVSINFKLNSTYEFSMKIMRPSDEELTAIIKQTMKQVYFANNQ